MKSTSKGLRSKSRRLTQDEKSAIILLYFSTKIPVLRIARLLDIDRRTLYRVVNKHSSPIRNPRSGNRTNHPTKFEKDLRAAAQTQLNRLKDKGGES